MYHQINGALVAKIFSIYRARTTVAFPVIGQFHVQTILLLVQFTDVHYFSSSLSRPRIAIAFRKSFSFVSSAFAAFSSLLSAAQRVEEWNVKRVGDGS